MADARDRNGAPRCGLLLPDVHLHTLTRAFGPPGHDDLEDAVLIVRFQSSVDTPEGLQDALERAERRIPSDEPLALLLLRLLPLTADVKHVVFDGDLQIPILVDPAAPRG